MLSIRSYTASGIDTAAALADLDGQITQNGCDADFVFAVFGCDHCAERIRTFLGNRFPGAALIGGTSKSGLMTGGRAWGADAIGILAIEDPEGQYGAAIEPIGDDPTATAERVLNTALENATCPGELPSLVFVYMAPGCEEDAIDGIRHVVGDLCPIFGGSSADNDASGLWRQIGRQSVEHNGIAVAVLFPSGGIGTCFNGGFEPAGPNGIVTRVIPDGDGKLRGHQIAEIDGRPAAHVYDEWTNNVLGDKAATGGNVFDETAGTPFGVETGSTDGVPHYLLVHPVSATSDGCMATFAAVEQGAHIHIMRGNLKRLAERAGHVVTRAVAQLPGGEASLAGGLMVYCAGCKRTVGDRIPEVAKDIAEKFSGLPHLCCFTFGEQGWIAGRNAHGNLMITAIAFGT
jgi:hypothetical protein